MSKPMIFFSREAESGNIFYILGMVQKAMRKQNKSWQTERFITGSQKAWRMVFVWGTKSPGT